MIRSHTGVVLILAGTVAPQIDAQVRLADSLPPGVTVAMVERGREVFEGDGMCAGCHGPGASGERGPDLTDAEWWHAFGSHEALVSVITRGVPAAQSGSGVAMPPRGGSFLTDGEIRQVAAYVWKVSHPADSLPAGVDAAMIDRGRTLYAGKGGCNWCHGAGAQGNVGPDLTDAEWLHAKGGYQAIVRRILAGIPESRSRSGVAMAPRGGSAISDDDVRAVAAYVWVMSRLTK